MDATRQASLRQLQRLIKSLYMSELQAVCLPRSDPEWIGGECTSRELPRSGKIFPYFFEYFGPNEVSRRSSRFSESENDWGSTLFFKRQRSKCSCIPLVYVSKSTLYSCSNNFIGSAVVRSGKIGRRSRPPELIFERTAKCNMFSGIGFAVTR